MSNFYVQEDGAMTNVLPICRIDHPDKDPRFDCRILGGLDDGLVIRIPLSKIMKFQVPSSRAVPALFDEMPIVPEFKGELVRYKGRLDSGRLIEWTDGDNKKAKKMGWYLAVIERAYDTTEETVQIFSMNADKDYVMLDDSLGCVFKAMDASDEVSEKALLIHTSKIKGEHVIIAEY